MNCLVLSSLGQLTPDCFQMIVGDRSNPAERFEDDESRGFGGWSTANV